MAARYCMGLGTWNTSLNWRSTDSGPPDGGVPTAADNVYLTANSGPLNINVAGACKSFNCSGYSGTLSGVGALTVAGNFSLSPTMTVTYTGTLTLNETCNIALYGKTLSNLGFSGANKTFSFTDVTPILISGLFSPNITTNSTVNLINNYLSCGMFSVLNTSSIKFNGYPIKVTGLCSLPSFGSGADFTGSGSIECYGGQQGGSSFDTTISTLPIYLKGGTINTSAGMRIPIIIDGDIIITSLAFGSSLTYNSGNITYTESGYMYGLYTSSIDLKNILVRQMNIKPGITISVISQCKIGKLIIAGNSVSPSTIKSSVSNTQINLDIISSDIDFGNFVDIDATGGAIVRTFRGTIINCKNIINTAPPKQKAIISI